MNLRQFFTNKIWWGKLMGALFGFLIAGPAGALFGILIGNFFDQGLREHFTNPYWHYHAEKRKFVQNLFFTATFSIMGHIAKADGRVSEQSIRAANELILHLNLNEKQQKQAKQLFNEGKNAHFDLKQMLISLYNAAEDNPALLKLFVDIQYQALQTDKLTDNKIKLMNIVLNYLHFAPLYQQQRFYEDFAYHAYKYRPQETYKQSSSTNESIPPYYAPPASLAHAYNLLEIRPSASQQEVKRAYRRLMSLHHPDKLIAKGMSEKTIKAANEKTQLIRKAYDQICTSRGWS